MKYSLSFTCEDASDDQRSREEIAIMLKSRELYAALHAIKELVRSRLKYGDNVSKEEEQCLEMIREWTYFEWMEL